MVDIQYQSYPLNPTLRLVTSEGRATAEFFRMLKAIGALLQTVTIVDGAITTAKLADLAVQAAKLDNGAVVIGKIAAGAIYVHTLFADEVVITSKVAPNAISELTALIQGAAINPGSTLLSGVVPISSVNNSGLLLTLTAFMDRPALGSGNFGYWRINLLRNGVLIDQTPLLFYDDNFSYQPVASFIDSSPGANPSYSVTTTLSSGDGDFEISGGVLNVGLLKR